MSRRAKEEKMNSTQLGGTSQKSQLSTQFPGTAAEFKVGAKPVVSYSGTQQNELLAALPREDLEALFQHLELVTLPCRQRTV